MQSFKNFVKRNIPVFIFGLVVALVFLLIILTQPKDGGTTPAGFKKVEDEVFERESAEPTPETKPVEYARQVVSPENKGKPYFYGEYDPSLRDAEGYPTPPLPNTVTVSKSLSPESVAELKSVAQESYNKRVAVLKITYTKEGFNPKDVNAYTGQRIEWVNETPSQITILQTTAIHEALKKGLVVEPGSSAFFRPLISGLFSYLEKNSTKYGTITVQDVTTPLQ